MLRRTQWVENGSQFSVQHLGTSFHSSLIDARFVSVEKTQQQRESSMLTAIAYSALPRSSPPSSIASHRTMSISALRSSRQRRSLRLVLASEERRRREAKLKIRANVERFLLAMTEPFSLLDNHDVSSRLQSNFLASPPEAAEQKDFRGRFFFERRFRLNEFRLARHFGEDFSMSRLHGRGV